MTAGEKIPLKEAIIVEGRYDKARVSALFDTTVVATDGFGIFSNREKLDLIRKLAKKNGIIILTDSDGAGFVIRNFLKGSVAGSVKHAYIPEIQGRERRKSTPSAEGILGVEGMTDDVIIESVQRAGAEPSARVSAGITKYMLYEDGLSGCRDSASKREALLESLGLPKKMSVSAMLDTLNALLTADEYRSAVKQISDTE